MVAEAPVEEIEVADGHIVGYKPRQEVASEVIRIMSRLDELKMRAQEGPARTNVAIANVAPAGFEPAISALRGLRPSPLDDGASERA
jgi:hypothetical protein